MDSVPVTHLLFDFFGTLVDYNPSNTEQDFSRSHRLLLNAGSASSYNAFLEVGRQAFADLDQQCAHALDEFSMHDGAMIIFEQLVGRPGTRGELDAFVDAYLRDWDSGVSYPDGIERLLRDLATDHRMAVVSNTHDPRLVPDHLTAMGVAELFDPVVLSVEVGRRKPHPEIYRSALDQLGAAPESALFIGDTYLADYVGPREAGLSALLIDPDRQAPITDSERIDSIFELPERLRRA